MNTRLHPIPAFLLLGLLAGCASAPPASGPAAAVAPAPEAPPGGVATPVCNWHFAGATGFDAFDPATGIARHYACPMGEARIRAYNLGHRDWTFGNAAFVARASATVNELVARYQQQQYRSVRYTQITTSDHRNIEIGGQHFIVVSFDLIDAIGHKNMSYLFLGEAQGNLLEYRLSFIIGNAPDYLTRSAIRFVEQSLQLPEVSRLPDDLETASANATAAQESTAEPTP